MDVILHVGAHRTASSAAQRLLERGAGAARARGVEVWTPRQTRAGLLSGVLGDPSRDDPRRDALAHRAAGRIAMRRAALTREGATRLVISEENLLGGLRENAALAKLYPSARARLARAARALPGLAELHLAIRSPDMWWTSAFAFLITRGAPPPSDDAIDAVARARRGWRQVVEDAAAAMPQARLVVWSYEGAGRPEAVANRLTGLRLPPLRAAIAASPSATALEARLAAEGWPATLPRVGDVWAPFPPDLRATLRDRYAEDVEWLASGADGLAEWVPGRSGADLPGTRGRRHGRRRHARSAQGLGAPG